MERKYFLCSNLDELEQAQNELVDSGFSDNQLHVLSNDDAGVEQHHMHGVNCFSKTDIVLSTVRGAIIGVAASALALILPYFFGMTNDIGWTPFIFLAIIALGFSTWEGGLWGIQELNTHYKRFEKALEKGRHVMIIDYSAHQYNALQEVVDHHPKMKAVSAS